MLSCVVEALSLVQLLPPFEKPLNQAELDSLYLAGNVVLAVDIIYIILTWLWAPGACFCLTGPIRYDLKAVF